MNRLQPVPSINSLPQGSQQDGAISIALEEGIPVLRASQSTQSYVEDLLEKQQSSMLTPIEQQELQQYEDVDDYLSYLNRVTRNLFITPPDAEETRATQGIARRARADSSSRRLPVRVSPHERALAVRPLHD